MHLFIRLTIYDFLSHCLCCLQPNVILLYFSRNSSSSVHGKAVSSAGLRCCLPWPGPTSPCVFSLGLMTAVMFRYTQWSQKGLRKNNKQQQQGFPAKLLQRLEQDFMQHIRTCPGRTQHSFYQVLHSVHVCAVVVSVIFAQPASKER